VDPHSTFRNAGRLTSQWACCIEANTAGSLIKPRGNNSNTGQRNTTREGESLTCSTHVMEQ